MAMRGDVISHALLIIQKFALAYYILQTDLSRNLTYTIHTRPSYNKHCTVSQALIKTQKLKSAKRLLAF